MTIGPAPCPASATESQRPIVLLTLWWLVVGAFAALALHNAVYNVSYLRYHDDTTYPESAIVERALALARGEALYGDTRHWPYNVAMYGPLNYYPAAWGVRLSGAAERYDQARAAYVVGRSISLASGFAIAAWLWLMAGRVGGLRGIWRWWPVALVFGVRPIVEYWPSFRPDVPLAALSLWAWVGLARPRRFGSTRLAGAAPVILAAVLISIGAAYKHTAAVSAAAIFVWLWADRRRGQALGFAVIVGVLVGAMDLSLYLSTNGAWYENTIAALRSPRQIANACEDLFVLAPLALLPLAGGFASLLGVGRDTEGGSGDGLRPARWAFAVHFVGAFLLAVRSGSKAYYYLEAYCWGALLFAVFSARCYAEIRDWNIRRTRAASLSVLLLCLLTIPALHQWVRVAQSEPPPTGRTWDKMYPGLAKILKSTRGPVFLALGYPYWLTQSPPTVMDTYLVAQRVAVGDLSTEDLVARFNRREFDLVVLTWDYRMGGPGYQGIDSVPANVVEAMKANYEPVSAHGKYYVYTPRRSFAPSGN